MSAARAVVETPTSLAALLRPRVVEKRAGDLRPGDIIVEGKQTTEVRTVGPCGRYRPGLHVNGSLCYGTPDAPVMVKNP